MRVAISDPWGCASSWAMRLKAEGCDVLVYHGEQTVADVGDGLFPVEQSYDRWTAWAKERPEQTVVLFCTSDQGEKADELRRAGSYVVGGGTFADKLERDRLFGQEIAKHIGLRVPVFTAYGSITDAIADWQGRPSDEGGVFKTDSYLESDATQICHNAEQMVRYLEYVRNAHRDRVKCVIQSLIGGKDSSDFDVNRWFDGKEFVGPYGLTMEKKRFLTGDYGPSTGCALTAFWFEEESQFARDINFDALGPIFADAEAPPGVYAVNCRISDDDGEAYFLEITPRLGFDSETTAALLIDSLSDFLWRVATGDGGTQISYDLAYSVRLSSPPYPGEEVKDLPFEPLPVPYDGDGYGPPFVAYQLAAARDGYELASPQGIIGLAAAVGDDLGAMHDEVMEFAGDLHKNVSKLQLRTDGAKVLQDDARKLEALGYDVHEAILKGAD